MLTANNLILDDVTGNANSAWRNINNWTSLSIHIKGISSGSDTIWIEGCNDPSCVTDGTLTGVPISVNLGQDTAGNSAADPTDQTQTTWNANGSQAMWAPSSLCWNYLRVCRTGGQTNEVKAFLFGQQG